MFSLLLPVPVHYANLFRSFRCCAVSSLLLISAAASDEWVEFHSENIQVLRGWDYELGHRQRTIVTMEHVNAWRYGDFFVFVDYFHPDRGDDSYYLEPTLRLSLNKIRARNLTANWIRDMVFAINIEKPKGLDISVLGGPGVDLNLPGFDFFNAHLYYRDDPERDGTSEQLTLVWKRPFSIGTTRWITEGFADLATAEGDGVAHQLIVPRVLMDLSDLLDVDAATLYGGIEYSYWHNKFGIDGVTERVPQLQLKWVL